MTTTDDPEAWLQLAQSELRQNRFDAMLAAAQQAAALRPRSVPAAALVIEALLLCGRRREARAHIAALESAGLRDPMVLSRVAELYHQAGAHRDTLRCCSLAASLAPGESALVESLAAAETACGNLVSAEQLYTLVLERNPRAYGSQYNRSVLRRQTAARNHVAELQATLATIPTDHPGLVPVCHALAKELEDVGRYAESFATLRRGAAARRARLSYSVDVDEQVFAAIRTTFSRDVVVAADAAPAGASAPIFVMGLPRSGTTLADRILGCHSAVESCGEINDFAFAMLRLAGPVPGKVELIRHTATLDFAALGRAYVDSVAGFGRAKARCIDKTPWNFLYLGLIALALPAATIVHVRRHPLDSCYALYKTLFRAGSPYSYDLDDIARYYIGYERLMRHWRAVLPGRFLDLDYEDLVLNQERASRALVAHCGLDWEQACLDFHLNDAPAATASAAQVRQPIYRSSLRLYRHYRAELAPLAERLCAAGIDVSDRDDI